MKRPLPDKQFLDQCLSYEPDTGILTWRERPASHFGSFRAFRVWNARYAGCRAGFVQRGYRLIGLNDDNWPSHRLIWKMVYGTDPEDVDHINRLRDDNRLSNLRDATSVQNRQNTGIRSDNTSGHKGVWRAAKRWRASIEANGVSTHLGYFDTKDEAGEAYRSAAQRLHGEFASY